MTETQEQLDIIQAVSDGESSLIVQAGPGCGKTYTNVKTMLNSGYGYKLALAFNKSIADELKLKAPSGITVQTTHAAGFQMLKSEFRSKLNTASPWSKSSKTYKIIQRVFPNKYSDDFGAISNALVSGIDKYGFGSDSIHGAASTDWVEALDDLPLDTQDKLDICTRMPAALDASVNETEEINFADMLTLPLYHDLSPQFPQTRIWGDEIQDWSSTQLRLVQKLSGPQTLFYGFGDKYQSIYAFRGADIHSMSRFQSHFNAKEMPLTQSFRCPQSVIELAQKRNPYLTYPDGTPYGVVDSLPHVRPEDCEEDTMVLCRLNAPLFSLGLKFLIQHRPVRISSNLPQSLKAVVKQMKTTDENIFYRRLDGWLEDQLEYAKDRPHLESLSWDKYNAILALAKHCEDIEGNIGGIPLVIDKLTKSFKGPLLTTVHKAKGLEAPRVILLLSKFLLSPEDTYTGTRPMTEDDLEQERNVWFVAITRAQKELFFA